MAAFKIFVPHSRKYSQYDTMDELNEFKLEDGKLASDEISSDKILS